MTAEQYEAVLSALGDKINSQATTIFVQRHEIEELKRKLAEAEGMETEKGVENE